MNQNMAQSLDAFSPHRVYGDRLMEFFKEFFNLNAACGPLGALATVGNPRRWSSTPALYISAAAEIVNRYALLDQLADAMGVPATQTTPVIFRGAKPHDLPTKLTQVCP
jgi:hypothetical protein